MAVLRQPLSLCLGVLVVVLLLATTATAQAVTGSIFGTVTDNAGAVIPGAAVTVVDVAKGTTFTATTNASGEYTVLHLIPDVYRVTVEAKGFDKFTQENVTVSADQGVKVDAPLRLGQVTTNVEVTSAPPLLKTDRADVSDTIATRDLENLPVTNRNFTDLELTLPGTVQLGWQHASSENPQGSAQIQVNGQQFSGTDFLLDGTDNRDPILGIIVINPNLDAIQEVKMTTTDFDAEFGSAEAIMGAQTKSGTNSFHGSAFDYLQNDRLNARDPFAQALPDPVSNKLVPPLRYNQFGVTGGGPIVKDKLFYFGDYQGVRRNRGGTLLTWVPTAAERSGDFSGVLGSYICNNGTTSPTPACAGSSPVMVPTTEGTNVPAQQNMVFNPASDSTGINRQVFSSGGVVNKIDPSFFDPAAVKLMSLLPLPNFNNGNPQQNFSSTGSELFHQNGFDTRIDYNVSATSQIFGRYSLQQFYKTAPGAYGTELGGFAFPSVNFAGVSGVRNQSLALGYTHTFSPTLLSDFRFGLFRYRVNVDPNGLGTTPAKDAGAQGLNLGDLFTSGMPAFYINNQGSNIGSMSFGYALGVNQCNCPLRQNELQLQWVGNVTKISGNHQFKFGADARHANQLRVPSDNHRAGELSFNTSTTGVNNPAISSSGEGFAAFLLGDVGSLSRFVSTTTDAAERQNRFFFYAQDTYRVKPTLTINYGLRWEQYRPQYVNGRGKGGWFDYSNANIIVGGYGPYNLAGNVEPTYKDFAPRVGIAWQTRPKTVLRVGYGRSYDVGVFGSLFGHTVTQNLPVLAFQNVSVPGGNAFGTAFVLSQGPPSGLALFPNPSAYSTTGEFPLPDGVNVNADERKISVPSIDSWNLTVEQQFTNTTVLDLAYVGNAGRHITAGVDFNQHPILPRTIPDPNDYRPYASLGIHPASIPLPDSSVNDQCNCDSNNYNALQVRFNKRFTRGYDFFSNYTWSKAMGFDDEYIYNWHQGYGPQGHDITHIFNFGQTWEIPVGKGRKYLGNAGTLLDYLVGGWNLNTNNSIYSGQPYSVSVNSSDVCPNCPFGIRAIRVANVAVYPSNQSGAAGASCLNSGANCWINGAAFAEPPAQTQGLSMNQFRGPAFWVVNAGLAKTFALTERVRAELRGELYNAFNHANLGLPDSYLPDYNPTPSQGNPNLFGTIGYVAGYAPNSNAMRYGQLALRLTW